MEIATVVVSTNVRGAIEVMGSDAEAGSTERQMYDQVRNVHRPR